MKNIAIIGAGLVGLVTGVSFALMGNRVTCIDNDIDKVTQLSSGILPFYEPGLKERYERAHKNGSFSVTADYKEALKQAEICFIAVDTPFDESGKLPSFFNALSNIAEHLDHFMLIVIKSTVPPGTTMRAKETLLKRHPAHSFAIVANPEFLQDGSALQDFLHPDRIVLGTDSNQAAKIMSQLYQPIVDEGAMLLVMDPISAELTKYASNAMLTLRVSFMNWLSNLTDAAGADILKIAQGVGADSRIGHAFLHAGCGIGGRCLMKDLKVLKASARDHGLDTELLDAIFEINRHQQALLAVKIARYFGGSLKGRVIAILGLAFKPDTSDLSGASSLVIIKQLVNHGAILRLFDPMAMQEAKRQLADTSGLYWAESELDATTGADAVAFVTEWKQFAQADFPTMLKVMKGRALFDGRNQHDATEMKALGFDYFGIGTH